VWRRSWRKKAEGAGAKHGKKAIHVLLTRGSPRDAMKKRAARVTRGGHRFGLRVKTRRVLAERGVALGGNMAAKRQAAKGARAELKADRANGGLQDPVEAVSNLERSEGSSQLKYTGRQRKAGWREGLSGQTLESHFCVTCGDVLGFRGLRILPKERLEPQGRKAHRLRWGFLIGIVLIRKG